MEADNIGIYKTYIKDTNSLKYLTLPPLFSESNGLNLGHIPGFLLIFTAVKEFLIMCIYIYLQVVHVYSQQYYYISYIYCFSQNILKIWR